MGDLSVESGQILSIKQSDILCFVRPKVCLRFSDIASFPNRLKSLIYSGRLDGIIISQI